MIDISGRIKEMLIDGFPVSDICSEIGLKKTRVYEIIKLNGWSELSKSKNVDMVIMLKNGEKIKDIANNFEVSEKTVYRLIDKLGLKYKPRKIRKYPLKNWPKTIFSDIDMIAGRVKYSNRSLNLDIDDIKDEIIEIMMIIDGNDNINFKEHYFRKIVMLRLNNYLKNVIDEKLVTESLTLEDGTERGVVVEYNIDYALDHIGDI